ncbi:hypothetical protein ABPG72_014282 [Tetrahymena utriculariae]
METINILQQRCESLYKSAKYNECIESMEELVSAKKAYYGEDSSEYAKSSERLCEVLNLSAMINLQKEKFDLTIEQLRKAEMLCHTSLRFKATTYNNLACFYRRTGKLRTAYNYLQMALEIELKMGNMPSLADTHLNLCAVLSQLDRHTQALEHSLLSIVILQDEFLQQTLKQYRESNGLSKSNENTGPRLSDIESKAKITDDRLAVLAIAYHNLGVELEHLKRYDESMKIYNRALNFASDNLGQNHSLVQNLTRVLQQAFSQLEGNKAASRCHVNGTKKQFRDIYRERVLSANVQHDMNSTIGGSTPSASNATQKNLPKLTKSEKLNTCISTNYYKPDNQESTKGILINNGSTPLNNKFIKRTMSGNDSIQNDQSRLNSTVRKKNQYFMTGSNRQTPTQAYKPNPQSFDFSNGNIGVQQHQRNMSANTYHYVNNSRPMSINDSQQLNLRYINKSNTPSNNNFLGTYQNNNNYSFDASLQNDIVYNSYNINKNQNNQQSIIQLTPNQIGLNSSVNQSINNFNNTNYQNSISSNSPQVQQSISFNQRNTQLIDNHQQPTYPIDSQMQYMN